MEVLPVQPVPGPPKRTWIQASRPWLQFYSEFRFFPRAQKDEHELSWVERLPAELQILVLSKVSPYQLGRVACVCRGWRMLSEHPKLWEKACKDAFAHEEEDMSTRLPLFRNSWRTLFISHPHLRFDGLYVSRNTYVRTGVVEWTRQKAVHLVVYYRYFRFFPGGALLYRTSPQQLTRCVRAMAGPCSAYFDAAGEPVRNARAEGEHVFAGRWRMRGNRVGVVVRYPNAAGTEIRCKLRLRSTQPGANNRLDNEGIVSYDRDTGHASALDGSAAANNGADLDEEGVMGPGAREHRRGLAVCVFVPWEHVHDPHLVFNRSGTDVDFFMPG